jgi:hypothetical protein
MVRIDRFVGPKWYFANVVLLLLLLLPLLLVWRAGWQQLK